MNCAEKLLEPTIFFHLYTQTYIAIIYMFRQSPSY